MTSTTRGRTRSARSRPAVGAEIGYLGWSGRGNLGDDVLRDIVVEALPNSRVTYLPMELRELPQYLDPRLAGRRRSRPLVLGGGTVVGRANWRVALELTRIACGGGRHLLGIGVEDPAFGGRHAFSSPAELRRWKPVLNTFEHVTVRGPSSAELLAGIGVDAEVVGDPALMLAPASTVVPTADELPVYAVSLGFGDDLWGLDQAAVTSAVATALRGTPCAVRVVVMNAADKALARQLEHALPDAEISEWHPTTPAEFFEAVEGVEVMIAERLHAGVLAAAADVPVVMLEYQPKCLDFMRSIGAADLSIRTDAVDAATVRDAIERASVDEDLRRITRSHVAAHRRRLRELLTQLTETLGEIG